MKIFNNQWFVHGLGCLLCLMMVVGYKFFYAPELAVTRTANQERLVELQGLVADQDEVRDEFLNLGDSFSQVKSKIKQLPYDIADSKKPESVKKALNDIFKASGLTVDIIEQKKSLLHHDFSQMKFAIKATGTYPQLCQLLGQLQTQKHVIRFDELNVFQDEPTVTLNLDATVSVYTEFNFSGKSTPLAGTTKTQTRRSNRSPK